MNQTVIRAEALRKVYGHGDTELVALRDVSIAVERGEVAALLGPSAVSYTHLTLPTSDLV